MMHSHRTVGVQPMAQASAFADQLACHHCLLLSAATKELQAEKWHAPHILRESQERFAAHHTGCVQHWITTESAGMHCLVQQEPTGETAHVTHLHYRLPQCCHLHPCKESRNGCLQV